MKIAFALLVLGVILLHQDFWLWTNKTLVFGFLPAGLAYHAGYSLLAMATMTLLVRFFWPTNLDVEPSSAPTAHNSSEDTP